MVVVLGVVSCGREREGKPWTVQAPVVTSPDDTTVPTYRHKHMDQEFQQTTSTCT